MYNKFISGGHPISVDILFVMACPSNSPKMLHKLDQYQSCKRYVITGCLSNSIICEHAGSTLLYILGHVLVYCELFSLIFFVALCPDPAAIVNGMVTSTGTSVGDTATYTCNSGLELIGDATTTCTQVNANSAIFSPNPPSCRRKYCINESRMATCTCF